MGQPLVRAMVIVMAHIAVENPLEMPCVHDQEVVDAFRSDRSHESFGVGVGIRSPKRCAHHPGPSGRKDGVEARDILRISVAQKEPWERAYDPIRGLIVRVNRSHRLFRELIETQMENGSLIQVLDIFLFGLARAEFSLVYKSDELEMWVARRGWMNFANERLGTLRL